MSQRPGVCANPSMPALPHHRKSAAYTHHRPPTHAVHLHTLRRGRRAIHLVALRHFLHGLFQQREPLHALEVVAHRILRTRVVHADAHLVVVEIGQALREECGHGREGGRVGACLLALRSSGR